MKVIDSSFAADKRLIMRLGTIRPNLLKIVIEDQRKIV